MRGGVRSGGVRIPQCRCGFGSGGIDRAQLRTSGGAAPDVRSCSSRRPELIVAPLIYGSAARCTLSIAAERPPDGPGVRSTTARPSAGSSPVRPRGRRRGVPGTTARPSAGSSPVRPRGCRRGVPRYDREAVSDQSQTLSVSEGESPLTLPVVVRKRGRFPGEGVIRIPRWEGVVGRSPSLTLRVWLWSPTASRSYRGTPRRRPRGRTGELPADSLALVLRTPGWTTCIGRPLRGEESNDELRSRGRSRSGAAAGLSPAGSA